jgi:hypothetical protein
MKKKEQPAKSLSASYSSKVIYREDLENIYKILNESYQEIQIEIDEYVLDSLDEIPQIDKDKAEYQCKIMVSEPNIEVLLSINELRIYSEEGTGIPAGIFARLDNLIKNTNLYIPRSILKIFGEIGSFLLLGSFLVFIIFTPQNYLVWWFIGIGGFFILLVPIGVFIFPKHNEIYLKNKKEYPSFFRRNKDEIVLNFIFLVIGIIIGRVLN